MTAVLIINGAFGIHINKGKCEQVPCVLCVGFQAGKNLSKVVDGVARIYGFELMQVAQALDLQKKVNHRQLSPQNEQLLKALRKQVVYPGCRGLNAIPDEVPRKPSPDRIDLRGSMLREPGIAFAQWVFGH
ncbi:hypothetical protein [Shewanella sp. MSW]|uniref:hypothetical protein n=1 Tax=Shewanella sp. MSW TaxID=2569536 RepID=UPI001186F2C7|nr:hypothetical protein [Shewanella sp. MSW]TVP09119.1 hypothetical protein AYI96_17195 [Shewanella sp. MSW]